MTTSSPCSETHLGTTTSAYDAGDRLTSLTPPGGPAVAYDYDANGNQIAAGADTFAWDAADRLTAAMAGGTAHTYAYAGDGRRLSTTSGGTTTAFVWDLAFGLPMLVAERDGTGAPLRSYAYGLDLLSQSAAGATSYYHLDGLGSVVDLTDPTGVPLAWAEYAPFGDSRYQATAAGAPTNPFRFTGEYLDPTGLYHLRARQFDPGSGRFLSTDPVSAAIEDPYAASYVYVRNNSLTFTDPTGRVPEGTGALDRAAHVARFVVNGNWTALGVTASYLTGSDYCEFKDQLIVECYGNDLLSDRRAITIGNSVSTQLSEEAYARSGLADHENPHTTQWMIPGFPALYAAGMLWSLATSKDNDLFCGNPFERLAGPTTGYEHCGWD